MQFKKVRKYSLFLILLIVILLGNYFRWLEIFELITFDWRLKLRGRQLTSPQIAIIEIGNDSLEQIGRWPFDRKYHAQLIRVLYEYGVRQICFDIIFDQKGVADNELILATKIAGNVYYPFGRNVQLIDGLKQVARGYGHINVTPDIDGKRRYIQPFIPYIFKLPKDDAADKDAEFIKTTTEPIFQLGILMACDYLGMHPEDLLLPLDEEGRYIINYAGPWKDTFKHFSCS